MEKLVLVIHVLASLGVIGLVLMQHGKGADMGAAFGSGASGSLFGVSGSSNFMSRATAIFVAVFFTTSLTLAYLSSHHESGSIVKSVVSAPAKDDSRKSAPTSAGQTDAAPAKDVPQ